MARSASKKSVEELKATGSFRPGKHGSNLDQVAAAGEPKPLRTLSRHEKKVWQTVVDNFPPSILGQLDSAALTMLCGQVGYWIETTDKMRKEKDDGKRYKLWCQAQGAANQANKLLVHFGMTPRSRTEIRVSEMQPGTKPTEETDPLIAMIAGRVGGNDATA